MPRASRTQPSSARLAGGLDSRELIRWWRSDGRDYPWRHTRDPFHVLVAEFMLRRTRADQVVPVYEEFQRRCSTPQDALDQRPASLDALLAPLGLQWRISQFRTLCEELVRRHQGHVPCNKQELLDLTGVGPYIAAAVRVFAFGRGEALVDVNVLRVLSRYFGISLGDGARRSPAFLEDVQRHLVPRRARREFWWAILDLAAIKCTPSKPQHSTCPLRVACKAAAAT